MAAPAKVDPLEYYATKADVAELRGETNAGFDRLEGWIDAAVARLERRIETGLAELRGDLKWLKWIGGALAAAVLAAFVRGLFLP